MRGQTREKSSEEKDKKIWTRGNLFPVLYPLFFDVCRGFALYQLCFGIVFNRNIRKLCQFLQQKLPKLPNHQQLKVVGLLTKTRDMMKLIITVLKPVNLRGFGQMTSKKMTRTQSMVTSTAIMTAMTRTRTPSMLCKMVLSTTHIQRHQVVH